MEPRHLLSTLSLVNLPASVTVTAGEPLMIALTGSGATTMTYTASSGSSGLTTTVLEPSANSVIQMQVQSGTNPLTASIAGDMDFQLFNNFSDMTTATSFFSNLVNTGFFNSAQGDTSAADGGKMIIFRDDANVLQAGSTNNTNSGGGSGSSFDDAYDPNLVYSSSGVLAMAKAENDGNDSQFFITNATEPEWNFQYTIIGFMVRGENGSGNSILQQIAAVPTATNPTTGFLEPITPVLIENMSMITDAQDAALGAQPPTTSAGETFTVTVTLSDGNSADTTTKTFSVTVAANTSTDPPYLEAIPNITTTAGTPTTVASLPTYDPTDASTGIAVSTSYAYDPGTPANGAVAVSNFSNTTGGFTLTPAAGFVGVSEVWVGVEDPNNPNGDGYDTQYVPVLVTPLAPTSLKLLSPSVSNVTGLENSLQFQVSGLEASSTTSLLVTLYENGTQVASGTATGSTLTLTTNPSTTFTPATYVFTATQTYQSSNIDIGNDTQPVTLASAASTALNVTVAVPQVTTLPSGLSTNHFTLRRSGNNVQLVNDSTSQVLQTWVNGEVTAPVQISGAANTAEQLTVDFTYGGTFSLPLGLSFPPVPAPRPTC